MSDTYDEMPVTYENSGVNREAYSMAMIKLYKAESLYQSKSILKDLVKNKNVIILNSDGIPYKDKDTAVRHIESLTEENKDRMPIYISPGPNEPFEKFQGTLMGQIEKKDMAEEILTKSEEKPSSFMQGLNSFLKSIGFKGIQSVNDYNEKLAAKQSVINGYMNNVERYHQNNMPKSEKNTQELAKQGTKRMYEKAAAKTQEIIDNKQSEKKANIPQANKDLIEKIDDLRDKGLNMFPLVSYKMSPEMTKWNLQRINYVRSNVETELYPSELVNAMNKMSELQLRTVIPILTSNSVPAISAVQNLGPNADTNTIFNSIVDLDGVWKNKYEKQLQATNPEKSNTKETEIKKGQGAEFNPFDV